MELVQRFSEGLARKTSRRGLFGRGAEVATGALLGVAAGTLVRPASAFAGGTACGNLPCPCDGCQSTGVCAKPCMFDTRFWAAGCWVLIPSPRSPAATATVRTSRGSTSAIAPAISTTIRPTARGRSSP